MSQQSHIFHRINDLSKRSKNTERDRYIYELVSKRHEEESDRLNRLDGKASQIVAISGIIISLEAGILNNIVESIPRDSAYYIVSRLLLVASLIFLLASIGLSLKAYSIKTVKTAPDTDYLLKNYTGDEVSVEKILILVTKELNEAILRYKIVNGKKAEDIKSGLYALTLGITAYFIFGFGILIL